MKDLLLAASICAIVFGPLVFPVSYNTTVIKSEIKSNQPFAGKIDGKVVGTDLCIKYWLEPREMSDTANVTVVAPWLLSKIGYVYSVETYEVHSCFDKTHERCDGECKCDGMSCLQ